MIRRVAFLSMHTSPLDLPGSGEAGGMNVYIDELAASLVGRGVEVTVFTRRTDPGQPRALTTSSGYRVAHVTAGPARAYSDLRVSAPGWVSSPERVTAGYRRRALRWHRSRPQPLLAFRLGRPGGEAIHRASAGQLLPHAGQGQGRHAAAPDSRRSPLLRIAAETEVIAFADCVVASTEYEAMELIERYGADPSRVCVNPPGVDLDRFRPGDRSGGASASSVSTGLRRSCS